MATMMDIHPHKGVGAVAFGMTRAEVERVIGQVPRRARRNEFDPRDYDLFERLGFFVYYDADDRAEAIELTRIAPVAYEGYVLFAHPALEVREWARARDAGLQGKDGFSSDVLGLRMYAPSIDEPDLDEDERAEPAQSFLAFKPGSGRAA
jgi:hypothetical protein